MIRCLLLTLLCVMIYSPARAQATSPAMDYTAFHHLPVLHEGRVKPLDSFARTTLKIIAGKNRLPGMEADAWLAETIFDPADAISRPAFHILHPDQLNLPPQPGKLYSYAQLAPALQEQASLIGTLAQQDENEWSVDQRALMDLHHHFLLYTQLLRSVTGILPLAVILPDSLRIAWKIAPDKIPHTLNEFQPFLPRLNERVKKIVAAKGDNFARYTEDEKNIAALGWQLQIMENAGQQNIFLRIIPPQWEGDEWLSPWALTQTGKGAPQAAAYLEYWGAMAHAWQAGDATQWKNSTDAARHAVQAMPGNMATPWRLSLEIFYNDLHPVDTALLCYLLAFIALIGASFGTTARYRAVLLRASFAALLLGAIIHGAGIVMRIIILERPPVGTLYESILFVSWICVIGALMTGKMLRDTTGLLIAALSGALLLFTAGAFAPDDTMQVLVAVLNTNFWLATHVVCITIGYGWCLVACVMGHLYLVQALRGKTGTLTALQPVIKTTLLCALLFTAVGTILGGIWADQSWGRFWGWDPKENGALLIVLWLIWILHGRISGHISRLGFVVGAAALGIVVALAWFGVNLLSTGLHSYGFIQGVAAGLFTFCAIETILICALWYGVHRLKDHPA